MATLYNLTADYTALLELAEDPETDPKAIADTLEALGGEIEEKAEGYAMVMKELEAQETALKNEVDRLNARRLAILNNIRCMKLSLQDAMETTGKTKFKTTLFSFGIQKNPPSVVLDVDDVYKLPKQYLKYKEPDVDKAALIRDLKAGKDLNGMAHLFQSESLRIR